MGAYIKIPIPYVPFTLQVFFVIFAGALLGSRLGLLSQLVYILIGLVGVPIFTNGGGPGYILQPTFGYLIGFAIGAYVIGKLIENMNKYKFINFLLANLAGLIVIYFLGVVHFYIIMNFVIGKSMGIIKAIWIGFLVPLPGDLILAVIAASISKKVIKQVREVVPVLKK